MRGILVLALALGILGALTVASMAHATGHSHGRVAFMEPWMW